MRSNHAGPPPNRLPTMRRLGETLFSGPRADWLGGFLRGMLIALIGAGLLLCAGSALAVGAYVYVARQLPAPEELLIRAKTFESTRIYDRNGVLLWEIMDPSGGRRTVVRLQSVPLIVREATIATEDPTFYSNPGVNPLSIARAFWQNLRQGEIASGASTITQQLVKNLFLSPEVTYQRKIKEAVLATEVTRRYSKDEILEIYLNQVYYGNMAYGIGTAAEVYFQKSVDKLSLAEGAMIVGMAQGPAIYDPYTNLDKAKMRQGIVLDLMVKRGYITSSDAERALAEELVFAPPRIEMKAPHFSVYVREQLEAQYGTDLLYRGGLQVTTTLDMRLQEAAERIVRSQIDALAEMSATNASLVAMNPQNGEILAMVGSVDFNDPSIDGQVNVALRPRQPGSSIKPVTYLAAFERGWTAATFIMDVTTEFPDGANPPYVPKNHDDKEHGPVLVRDALARSLNIPAVKALQFVTVPGMLEMAHRLGITSLNRSDYGLALTLGGGDVTLLEMTTTYAVIANGGHRVVPQPILRIEDSSGRLVFQAAEPHGDALIDPRHAYIITSILSDREARIPTFGTPNALELSRPAAAKTGTTDDYRDAWTLGYTPDLVTGVWVGNSNGQPMKRVFGSRGAAPIWHDFMEEALADTPVHEFAVPDGLVTVDICPISGKLHTDKCPAARKEIFVAGTEPKEPCDMHVDVRLCTVSGLRATQFCPDNVVQTQYFEVYPPEYRAWAEAQGIPQPPVDSCTVHTRAPRVELTQPPAGSFVQGVVPVYGSARIDDMDHYELQYGIGDDPLGWGTIARHNSAVEDGLLGAWDTGGKRNGLYSLRVVAFDHHGNSATSPAIRVMVQNPTPTTTPTVTATATLLPTATPTDTSTPMPTETPTRTPVASATPTETPVPEDTATLTPSATPSQVSTDTPAPEPTSPPVQPTPMPEATPTVQS
jgi:1A family penicillin-binding protein